MSARFSHGRPEAGIVTQHLAQEIQALRRDTLPARSGEVLTGILGQLRRGKMTREHDVQDDAHRPNVGRSDKAALTRPSKASGAMYSVVPIFGVMQ